MRLHRPATAARTAWWYYSDWFLAQVFRHGNRTPEAPYPNDPNKDYAWPPTGWDQLSKVSMAEQGAARTGPRGG